MNRRARISLPIHIKLTQNLRTGLYEATENGVTYQLTFVQMNDLKIYCWESLDGLIPTVETWYNSLSSYSWKAVKRIGAERESDGFYPDE